MHDSPPQPSAEAPEPAAYARLSVVMPAYNEGAWVRRALDALEVSSRLAEWPVEVVVVDDGSSDPASLAVLDEVSQREYVRVISQANAGRFAARRVGLEAAEGDLVLLLDARVEVDPASLGRLRAAVARGEVVWNYDVTPASRELGALFWTGVTKVWWRDYFRHRKPVQFGLEDFDRYPKGTGAFLAPRQLLLAASGQFSSHFEDQTLASDDTRLLREVAAAQPIRLSPEVMCRHHAKSGRHAFTRQCYFRGTTFVDGYLSNASSARGLLAAAGLAGGVGVVSLVLAPRATTTLAAAGCVAAGALTRWSGGTSREAVSVGLLTPVFGATFGAGVIRGLRMASARPRG